MCVLICHYRSHPHPLYYNLNTSLCRTCQYPGDDIRLTSNPALNLIICLDKFRQCCLIYSCAPPKEPHCSHFCWICWGLHQSQWWMTAGGPDMERSGVLEPAHRLTSHSNHTTLRETAEESFRTGSFPPALQLDCLKWLLQYRFLTHVRGE